MPWAYEAVGTSDWTGTPLAPLIERAVPHSEVIEISFTGADYGYDAGVGHYFGRSLTLNQIKNLEVLLVYDMNGQPLLPQHGAPLRIIVPGWYGMASVKWLKTVEALTEPFLGFQQTQTYRFRQSADDEGQPVTSMRVKSLMVPPGVPDWISRNRCVEPGKITVNGRAWSGAGNKITRVEFGIDGNWEAAEILDQVGKFAWTGWRYQWEAKPGEHILQCRASDESGETQPITPPWDFAGFGNNAVQSVTVFVKDHNC